MRRLAAVILALFSFCAGAVPVKGVWEQRPQKLGDEGSVIFDLGRFDGSFYVEGLPAKGADFGVIKVIDTETKRNEQGSVTARMKVVVFGVDEIRPAPLQLKVLTEKGETVFEGVIDPVATAMRLSGSEPPPSLAGPVELPKPFPLTPWLLGAGGLLVLAVILFFLLRKKPSKAAGAKEELTAESSPDEWVIRRLKAYVSKSLLSLQDYADMAYDIRLYLEKKRELKALECTTFELGEILSSEKPFRNLDVKEFLFIFTFCDFVKFARHFPDAGEEAKLKVILRDLVKEVEISMREEKKAA